MRAKAWISGDHFAAGDRTIYGQAHAVFEMVDSNEDGLLDRRTSFSNPIG
jgi:hypothetical protein